MNTTSSKHKAPARHKPARGAAPVAHWRDDALCDHVSPAVRLSVEANTPFMLHYGCDGWQRVANIDSTPLPGGGHAAELDLTRLGVQQSLEFTRRFIGARGWEHHDWQVRVEVAGRGRNGT
ncbi:MAG: hypothetical protein ACRETQ_07230 [Gammaproteobacteria bacterium]